MLISEKTTGPMYFFFASKEAYPIVRQLEKMTVKKAEAKVVKCAKNKYLSLWTDVRMSFRKFMEFFILKIFYTQGT